nr:lachesin-like [Lepeophtheirus salmonis]
MDTASSSRTVNQYSGVGWIKAGDQTILTLHKRVITHNSRIHVTHDEHRTWNLHIRQVQESDKGCYMCQINTAIMKKQLGCINVLVPPDILFEETSSDITVTENQNTTLNCRATGTPEPTIMWRREDGESFTIRDGRMKKRLDRFFGERLLLQRIRRKDMGVFMCIAQNSVPPAVSVRVFLNVNFAPSVKVENQLVGCPLGESIEIQCLIEAYPNAVNYWMKTAEDHEGEILYNSSNFEVHEVRYYSYKVRLTLRIHTVTKREIGIYTCISSNSLGQEEGTIRLYEIQRVSEESVITSSEMASSLHSTSSAPHSLGQSTKVSPLDKKDLGVYSSKNTKFLDAISKESQNSKENSHGKTTTLFTNNSGKRWLSCLLNHQFPFVVLILYSY